MTAAELYDIDSDFRSLIACWVRDRRAPLCMGDYLRERGMDGQAQCADWCAWEPDRPARVGKFGIYPSFFSEGYWWNIGNNDTPEFCDVGLLIIKRMRRLFGTSHFCCPFEAVHRLLDAYAECVAANEPVPTAQVPA